jgi:hypothetical protein
MNNKILIMKSAAEKAMAAEAVRTESLVREAGKIVAGILIVLGYQLLDAKTLMESPSRGVKILAGLSMLILGISLLLAFAGLTAKGYASYPRGSKLLDTLKPESVTEEAAEEGLVQLLLKTREQNALLNDAKARSLYWSAWCFFAGILLVAASQLFDAYVDTLL